MTLSARFARSAALTPRNVVRNVATVRLKMTTRASSSWTGVSGAAVAGVAGAGEAATGAGLAGSSAAKAVVQAIAAARRVAAAGSLRIMRGAPGCLLLGVLPRHGFAIVALKIGRRGAFARAADDFPDQAIRSGDC